MKLTLTSATAPNHPDHLVPVYQQPDFAGLPEPVAEAARTLAGVRGFTGKTGETLLVAQGREQWLFCGLGGGADFSRPSYMTEVARGFKALRKLGGHAQSLHLPADLPWSPQLSARYTGEALAMAAYAFDVYKTQTEAQPDPAVELVGGGDAAALAAGLDEAQIVGGAVALTRDLVNQPAEVAHPGYILDQARHVATQVGGKLRVITGEDLREQGYGAIYGVGKGSEHPPHLAVLEYGEAGPDRPTVALVGKGITFDTGGLDIKPASGMALMKKDMGGAATVLGAFQAIAGLKLPVHLVTVLALAENSVDARSFRPGDVLRSRQGLTIEITNTDAEGRLVLADAFALAKEYEPYSMVDFATLTGACRIALGPELMGLFCDHARLRESLVASSEATGDGLWPLPLHAPYRKKLDSAVADLVNAASDGMAGATTAALFLKEFAGSVAWAHLDCYAWTDGENPLYPKGGSGIGVRLMVELMPRLIQEHNDAGA